MSSSSARDPLSSRLDFLGLDAAALDHLAGAQDQITAHLVPALDSFYAKIAKTPEVSRFFNGKSHSEQAKGRQVDHWKTIASGKFDAAYQEASGKVGLVHARIGLEPRWHIGGYGVIMETLVKGMVRDCMEQALAPKTGRFGRKIAPTPDAVMADVDQMSEALVAMLKAMLLDVDLGVTAYFDKLTSDARAADDAAKAKVDRAVDLTGAVLKDLANGDLTSRITADFDPEFAQIKDDTNAVAERLTAIATQLRQTSRSLKIATGEILAGANDLADRTTRQAATIEQTTAAVEQLSATVVENAQLASTASVKAQSVSHNATAGGEVMTEANGAMGAIETSSGKISNIIGLIDDIAFQTNLLALNASVEAARAGDAGKGFAVVAVEVRRLAQSAASASADVKVLIESSASEVRHGTQLVAKAADVLREILDGAQESATLINTIAQANKTQSEALGEVAIAVRQMDEMTQHNSALVEQTNAAIEQTEARAGELDEIVDVFKIGNSPKAAPTGRAGARPVPAMKRASNLAVSEDWNEY